MNILGKIATFISKIRLTVWGILPSPIRIVFTQINRVRAWVWRFVPRPLKFIASSIGLVLTTLLAIFGLFFVFPDLATPLTDGKGKNYDYEAHQPHIIHLDQGWNEAFRHNYYFTPQGSEIIPLDTALALEAKDSDDRFFGPEGLAVTRFGFIPYPASTRKKDDHNLNKTGLPLGFTIDGFIEAKFEGTHKITRPMLGMNCAACHTSNMTINAKIVRIDGNQSLGDFMGLLTAIDDALAQTYASDAKFERYAAKMGAETHSQKAALRKELKSVWLKRDAWQRRNRPDVSPGHGRVDAFGVIFNQVTARDLHRDGRVRGGNARAPNAPVSYPVLWDTPQMARVQWNGSANNKKAGGVLGRNFGQVLGVFGSTEVTKQDASLGYCSTVKRHNLNKMDYWIRSLTSPKWNDPALEGLLPALDFDLVASGSNIFQNACSSCHADIPQGFDKKDPRKKDSCDLPVTMVDVDIVGTDPFTALTGIRGGAKTGTLENLDSLSRRGKKMAPEEPYANVLREVVTQSIVGSFRPLTCDSAIQIKKPVTSALAFIDMAAGLGKISKSRKGKAAEIGGGYDFNPSLEDAYQNAKDITESGRDPASECTPESTKYVYLNNKDRKGDNYHPFGYRARPLNGIWASAPYLHNGSVPTLENMLNPAADPAQGCPEDLICRPDIFYVGSTNFDPQSVGYFHEKADGLSEFNTRLPGNSNRGHNWGTRLTQAEKKALLEYLKSL